MSTSPDDLPEARARAPRARATRATTRARPRPEVVEAPVVEAAVVADAVVADDTQTAPNARRTRTDGANRTDGNGAGKLPRAARRTSARQETKVATAPARTPRLERRFRQTVTKVDLWSVTKLSLCFYVSAMFVTVIALVALWSIADAAGIVKSVEKFIGDLLDSKNFHFLSAEVLRGAVLVGLVVVALQVVITVVAASFYNIFAELFGGIEITVKEEETPPGY
jgi:hypothetical protein